MVAIQPETLTPREVMTRLGAPLTGATVESFLGLWAERESAPRLACGICQFEYPKAQPVRHTCRGE